MRQIPIRLKLDKVDPRVVPDMSASADVTLESEQQATLVPLGAVFHDGPAAKPFVFLRSPKDGKNARFSWACKVMSRQSCAPD